MKRRAISFALALALILSISSVAYATTKSFYKTIYGGPSNLSKAESGTRSESYMVVQLNINTQFNGQSNITFRAYKGTARAGNAMSFYGNLPTYEQQDYWDITTVYTVICNASIPGQSTSDQAVISGTCFF